MFTATSSNVGEPIAVEITGHDNICTSQFCSCRENHGLHFEGPHALVQPHVYIASLLLAVVYRSSPVIRIRIVVSNPVCDNQVWEPIAVDVRSGNVNRCLVWNCLQRRTSCPEMELHEVLARRRHVCKHHLTIFVGSFVDEKCITYAIEVHVHYCNKHSRVLGRS